MQTIRAQVEKDNVKAYNDNWNAHELEQSAAFLIVFSSYFDCPSRETFHIFRCT